ncbi:MAG: bifunctional DNA primase/polymerase [Candidatus Nanopelagicales bacterium]
MLTDNLRFFTVWGLSPMGECLCPGGVRVSVVRDARVVVPGNCPRPGKHPSVDFPHGLNGAVPLVEVPRRPGVRLACAVPGGWWVLDVDGPAGWRGLVRLVAAGGLAWDQVRAVARTPRGFHVWVQCEDDRWTTARAQAAVNAALDQVGAVRGLEVKSGGGYVLWPGGGGGDRVWLDREMWAGKVAWNMSLLSERQRGGWVGAGLACGPAPQGYSDLPGSDGEGWTPQRMQEFPPEVFGMSQEEAEEWGAWSDEDLARWRAVQWERLGVACAVLAGRAEGDRNIMLNRAGWVEGRAAIEAGVEVAAVVAALEDAGVRAGLVRSEVVSTIRSALRGLTS